MPIQRALVCTLILVAGSSAQSSELTSVEPNLISPVGGIRVKFLGSDLRNGDTLWLGGEQLTGVRFVSSGELSGLAPSLRVGVHTAEVKRAGIVPVVAATLPRAVTVAAPASVSAVKPKKVSRFGGTAVVVLGSGFVNSTVIQLDSHALLNATMTKPDGTEITGEAPPLASTEPDGLKTVTAEDSRGTTSLPQGVEYFTPAPEIERVEPSLVSVNGGTRVAFLGKNFTALQVPRIDSLPLTEIQRISSSRVEGLTPALSAGLHEARIYGGAAAPVLLITLPDAVEAGSAPTLSRVEPREVCVEGGARVILRGSGFRPQTRALLGQQQLEDSTVSADGTEITGVAPALGSRLQPGLFTVAVEDERGSASLRNGIRYIDQCAGVPGPQQVESTLAEGTARFHWFNPVEYASILVLDSEGRTLRTLAGNATSMEMPVVEAADKLDLQMKGITSLLKESTLTHATAVRLQCEYPPALYGNVEGGEYELFVHGDHSPATGQGCSGAGGGGGGVLEEVDDQRRTFQPDGSTGFVFTNKDKFELNTQFADLNKITTGFTLENDADKLEFQGFYQKLAVEFGLTLRAKLRHIDPADGFADEFTFPDPFVGGLKSFHSFTYFRADRDPSDPQAQPCTDQNGKLKKIPKGDYLLDIYAVGGDRKLAYYSFGDDPRDVELLIKGSPCPPYPLVRVRDLTGFPSLPNVSIISVEGAPVQQSDGVLVTFQARGTWLDASGNLFSIDQYCDKLKSAPPHGFTCADPPYQNNPDFEFAWIFHDQEPPRCEISSSSSHTTLLPDWGCYKIELIVRDKRCAVERESQHELAIVPATRNLCTPGNQHFSFVFPTPDPSGIVAITDLNPSPGSGDFHGQRPVEFRVLVVPRCYCDGDPPDECPAAQLDDVAFSLAVTRIVGGDYHYSDLNAEDLIKVENLCPNVVEGPVYFKVSIDDLGKIDRHPQLDDFIFRGVAFLGKTVGVDDSWHRIGEGYLKMTNSPESLATSLWSGNFEPGDASYHFVKKSDSQTETQHGIPNSDAIDFGIADAGIPAYQGNVISSGLTSRFRTQGVQWFAEAADGTMSGQLLDNSIEGSPHRTEGVIKGGGGGNGGGGTNDPPVYQWCSYAEIVNNHFSQELFDSIIFAGWIGPINVNIWASVSLGLQFMVGSYVDVQVSPFKPNPETGNYVDLSFNLLSRVGIQIPCEVSCDIMGGIASIAIRLVPEASMEVDPYVNARWPSQALPDVGFYLGAFFNLTMEAEACIQTILFGEQCTPTIEIPLIECAQPFGSEINPQNRPNPTRCSNGGNQWPRPDCGAGAGTGGGVFGTSNSAVANAPVSLVSPDGKNIVDLLVNSDSGTLLKICVNNEILAQAPPLQGMPLFYVTSPAGAFVSNDKVIFAWVQPAPSFDPEEVSSDPDAPSYLVARNRNAAHAEVSISLLDVTRGELGFFPPQPGELGALPISDPPGTAEDEFRVDGKPSIAGDLSPAAQAAGGEAIVAWVRYESDYLYQAGSEQRYVAHAVGERCAGVVQDRRVICHEATNVVRPRIEKTAIYARRVSAEGNLPSEEKHKLSGSGINIEPSIALSPSGQMGYCVWVHDATHTDLVQSNRGRSVQMSLYTKATDTWSAPVGALPNPDNYPGILEPRILLKSDGTNGLGTGMLVFTALDRLAPVRDTGLGGSRFVYACRITDGVVGTPFQIHGKCLKREYGWSNSVTYDIPDLIDPRSHLHIRLPEWVMSWQRTGPLGLPDGSGNVMVSVSNPGSDDWSAPIALLPEGEVISNVRGVMNQGLFHSVHLNSGNAKVEVGLGGGAGVRAEPKFETVETRFEPDLAVVGCSLSDPFSGPGGRVTARVEVENVGLASSPTNDLGQSVTGLQAVLVSDDGTERIVDVASLQELQPGESTVVAMLIEMPHDPVRLRVQLGPNPIDRALGNNWKECYFGAPAVRDLSCAWIFVDDGANPEATAHPFLAWTNTGIYDEVMIYRDGSMLTGLPGGSSVFTDLSAASKSHLYEVRGRVGASKSRRIACDLGLPTAGGLFRRGDADGDGKLNITDPIFTLNFLFSGGRAPDCMKSADVDDSGVLNITDPIFSLSFQFLGGPQPKAPGHLTCGSDPTEDTLSCDEQ